MATCKLTLSKVFPYGRQAFVPNQLASLKAFRRFRTQNSLVSHSLNSGFVDYSDHHGDEYKQVCAEALKTIEEDLMKPTFRSESVDLISVMQEVGEGLGYQVEYSQSRLLVIPRVGMAHQKAEKFLTRCVDDEDGWEIWNGMHLQLPCGSRRQPDISGWRKPVVLDNQASQISKRPDWVCEILSKKTKKQDLPGGDKFTEYETSCIPYYWIVDPLKGEISVYKLMVDEYAKIQEVSLEGDSRSVLCPFKIELDFEQIFKYLRE